MYESNEKEIDDLAGELIRKLNAEVNHEADTVIIHGHFQGRRVELVFELDPQIPDLEVRITTKNDLGYLDLYYDPDQFDDDGEDPDFDFVIQTLGYGTYLEDYRRNVEAQRRVINDLPEHFIYSTSRLMQKFAIDNIEFDHQFAEFMFAPRRERRVIPNDLLGLFDEFHPLAAYFEPAQ